MATNPMQRKARNSFLLGMLVMLLISGVIIALLFMQLSNKIKKEQEELKASVKAYVLLPVHRFTLLEITVPSLSQISIL